MNSTMKKKSQEIFNLIDRYRRKSDEKISWEKLAKASKVSRAFFYALRDGRAEEPSKRNIEKVAKVLGVKAEILWGETRNTEDIISVSEQKIKSLLEGKIVSTTCPKNEKKMLLNALENASRSQLEDCLLGLVNTGLQKSDNIIPWLESIFEVHFDARFPEADELPLLKAKAAS